MKCRLALIIFPLLLLQASADDLHDRFEKAVKELRSDDAAERDKGSAELEAIAKEAPELVLPLAKDADPEMRERARELLKRLHLLADSKEERRAMDILDRLSEVKGKERDDLIDELLALGEPAARLWMEEFANHALDPVEQPAVAAEGDTSSVWPLTARNMGRTALWVGPGDYSWREHGNIGRREELPSSGPEDNDSICFRGNRLPPNERPEFHVRDWPQKATRIPVGKACPVRHEAVNSALGGRACEFVTVSVGRSEKEGQQVEVIGGVEVEIPSAPFPKFPWLRAALLQQVQRPEFSARIVHEGMRFGLEVEALKDWPEVSNWEGRDNFWFAAVNRAGEVTRFGPMGKVTSDRKSWSAGETETQWLEPAVPDGTVRLWLGYDIWEGYQLVPAPLELSESEKPK